MDPVLGIAVLPPPMPTLTPTPTPTPTPTFEMVCCIPAPALVPAPGYPVPVPAPAPAPGYLAYLSSGGSFYTAAPSLEPFVCQPAIHFEDGPIDLPEGAELAVSWRPPPDGWIKLNADGSFLRKESRGGAGFVARDSDGRFVFAGASCCPGVHPLYSELWAIRAELTEAKRAGFPRVVLESDSSSAVDILGGRIKNPPRGAKQLAEDCRTLRDCFQEITVQHTYREGNKVADRLAALGRRSRRTQLFLDFDSLPDPAIKESICFDYFGGFSVRPAKNN